MKGLLEHAWHQRRFAHGHGPFGHWLGNGFDVHCLEVFLVHAGPRRLPGDAQNWDAVGNRRIQAGDHVGARRAAGADAHADVAGPRPREALGHMRRALHVPRQHMVYGLTRAQLRVQRIDRRAGHAKGLGYAFFFHHKHSCHCGFHLGHTFSFGGVGFKQMA